MKSIGIILSTVFLCMIAFNRYKDAATLFFIAAPLQVLALNFVHNRQPGGVN